MGRQAGRRDGRLVWVKSDAATLRYRLAARDLERDSAKLATFETFSASMRLGAEPAAPHLTIDNRLTAATTLEDQVATLIASVSNHRAPAAVTAAQRHGDSSGP